MLLVERVEKICYTALHRMSKALTIVGWFVIIVLAAHYVPLFIAQGIPHVAQTAQALTTNITSFIQF